MTKTARTNDLLYRMARADPHGNVTLTLRLPVDLAGALKAAAQFDRRSINSQITYLLAKALTPPEGDTCPWCFK